MKNSYSDHFAYISGSYAYLKQADPDTVKEGGKDFDSVLFTIQYDDTFEHYCISNYKTQNYLAFTESYPNDAMDPFAEERGWYILKTNDGYYQFVLCSSILSPTMMKSGTNTADGAYVQMGAYDASSSMGKWSLYLSANVKNMEQKQTNYCSVTSTVQLLYALGQQSIIETVRVEDGLLSSLDDEDVIGSHYGLYQNNNGGDSSVVLYFLQEYISYPSYVSYCWFTNSLAETWIFQSFCKSAAVMVYSHNTEVFSYYENNHYEHFFMIAGIDIGHRNNLLVNDCNLFSGFNGVHFITSSELVNMDGYSCIYVSPDYN